MRRRSRVVACLAGLVVFLGAGCEVDATVDVRVREDGSGVVRVLVEADAEAVTAAESGGAPLEQAVRLEDLGTAGWDVGTWERADDGSASIVLSKPFESPEEVAAIVREASGEAGPIRLRAGRDAGFLATEYSLEGRVDLDGVDTSVLTDPELLANLGAQAVDPAVIDQQLLAQVQASFGLSVTARLPGAARQTVEAEPGAVTRVDAVSSVEDTRRVVLLAVALGLAVLAVMLWIRGGKRRRRRGARGDGGPRRGDGPPRRPRVPHPHVPHPRLPHPHLPRRGQAGPSGAPPPPPRRPPMIPPE